MEEILHHLTCMKPCKQWDIYHIKWLEVHQQYQWFQGSRKMRCSVDSKSLPVPLQNEHQNFIPFTLEVQPATIFYSLVYEFHQMFKVLWLAGGYRSHAAEKSTHVGHFWNGWCMPSFSKFLGTLGSRDFHEKNHGNHHWSHWILTVTQAKTLVIEAIVSMGEKHTTQNQLSISWFMLPFLAWFQEKKRF